MNEARPETQYLVKQILLLLYSRKVGRNGARRQRLQLRYEWRQQRFVVLQQRVRREQPRR